MILKTIHVEPELIETVTWSVGLAVASVVYAFILGYIYATVVDISFWKVMALASIFGVLALAGAYFKKYTLVWIGTFFFVITLLSYPALALFMKKVKP